MRSQSGDTVSLWLATAGTLDFPRLESDAHADVCVIGAGIAGLSVAYELACAGRSVIVIDRAGIGDGMTGRTTAQFTNAFDDRYAHMEHVHGGEAARLLAESHTWAIERTAKIVAHEHIDCDVERLDGWLFAELGDKSELLEQELEAVSRANVPGVSLERRAPLAHETGPALRFANQLQLHPVKLLHGLARAIERRGGRIHAHTHADVIEGGEPCRIQTERGPTITARAVVVATNSPVNDLAVIHTKQVAWQTYVVVARVPRGSVARAIFWDTEDPYHYVRLASDPGNSDADFLIVGGEDHRTGQDDEPEARWTKLETWMRGVFPTAGPIVNRWSGEVLEPVDGLAFIGRNPLDDEHVYIVTGDSGNGMTHGVIAGRVITDLIEGRDNRWADLYDPRRRSLRTTGTYIRENLIIAREYGAWFAKGDVADASEIPRGEGAILRRGLNLFAVYVDERGTAHESSAACPHMGCVVRWNGAERSWDCPCHGSRFDALGQVTHGPAISGLKKGADVRGGSAT